MGSKKKKKSSCFHAQLHGAAPAPDLDKANWKGERSSHRLGENRNGKSQRLPFGQPHHCVSPSLRSSQGLDTRHSHGGSHDIDSVVGSHVHSPGDFPLRSHRLSILHADRVREKRVPGDMPVSETPKWPGLASQTVKLETAQPCTQRL